MRPEDNNYSQPDFESQENTNENPENQTNQKYDNYDERNDILEQEYEESSNNESYDSEDEGLEQQIFENDQEESNDEHNQNISYEDDLDVDSNEDTKEQDSLDVTVSEDAQEQDIAEDKKSKRKMITMIVAAIATVSVIFGVLAFVMFNKGIKGSWEESNGEYILTFKRDGVVSLTVGSLTQDDGSYNIKDRNNMTLKVAISGLESSADVNYKITGNIITGRQLTLNYGDGNVKTFNSVNYSSKVKAYDEYNVSDELIGSWTDQSGYFEFTFYKNGIYVMENKSTGVFSARGPYTVDGNKIKRSFVTASGETKEVSEQYSVSGDKLILEGVELTKVKD